ncbi:MAG: tetraacyldisaccharide 4'-kinase, partial [Thermodesulfobacteriota bacterium]
MSVEKMIRKIWDEGPNGRNTPLLALLRLLSLPYGSIVAARNRLYDGGLLKQQKLPRPVISVGNLTVGGTGKTPTVIFIAHIL